MNRTKKFVTSLFVICLILTQSFSTILADNPDKYVEVTEDVINIRTGPATSYSKLTINNKSITAKKGECFTYIETVKENNTYSWYHISYIQDNKSYDGYIRNDLATIKEYSYATNYDFNKELFKFPESYRGWLLQLHYKHPSWQFFAYNTGISFQTMLNGQNVKGRALIQSKNSDYLSKASGCYDSKTGKYIALDGTSWYQASEEVVAYYVDPRNFLNEDDIYMFLKLKFSDCETEEVVQKILNGTFMAGKSDYNNMTFAQIFYQAGKDADISPIYLAALAIQEMGRKGNVCATGQSFTYNNVTYSGLYNFYNIGATSGTDNWKKGLIYANGGVDGKSKSFSRPWTNQYKAIYGGALWIGDGYINDGQDTMYFQKFNSYSCIFYHQYMTNVQAAVSQSSTLHKAYSEVDGNNAPLTFVIPVYSAMPQSTVLPGGKPLVAPDITLEQDNNLNFIKECGLYVESGTLSGFNVNSTVADLINKITKVNNELQIEILNNDVALKDNDILKTGQKIKITGGDSFQKSYILIIKGDCNCDGVITPADYVTIKNHITGKNVLDDNIKFIASDYNNDGVITPADYVCIKKLIISR